MGYSISSNESTIVFKSKNGDKALAAFQRWQKKNERLGFTTVSKILDAETLRELLEALRYDSEYTKDGDIHVTYFTGDKYGAERTIWDVLARYCTGQISYEGEDGCEWTYVMKKNDVQEK